MIYEKKNKNAKATPWKDLTTPDTSFFIQQ